MLLLLGRPRLFHLCKNAQIYHYQRFFTTKSIEKTYNPLRILFCGSDEFSIASLKALHDEHLKWPNRVASIDVVCRPGKRVGRGLKEIREGVLYMHVCNKDFVQVQLAYYMDDFANTTVPIKKAARNLSLPIHEIDTFTGWTVINAT